MSALDQPLSLPCGLTLPDRIAMAPLTNTQSHGDGTLGDAELAWLLRRARGGFRWVSTCAAFVSTEGHAWDGQLGIAHDGHLPGLTRLATALRQAGAHAVVQLHHGGVQAKLAPDPISTGGPAGARAATAADLARITEDFVAAARRAEGAGFAGVELHGANGYLFTQFLSPADNPRADDFGGPLEGRARYLRQTMQAVRAAVAPTLAVGVRLSPVDSYARRGLVLSDGVQVAQWLAEDGADFVHLSLRDAAAAPPFEPEAGAIATAMRDALPERVALFAAGGIWTRDDAYRAMDAGVDVVVLGRASIGNPGWPRASAQAGWSPSRPPWTEDHLREVEMGEAMIDYIRPFPGMVVGGTPAR